MLFSSRLLGVDIGASAIKIVEGSFSKKGYEVHNLACLSLPAGAVTERDYPQRELLINQLASGFAGLKKKKPSVATSFRGSGVLTKRILMPKVPVKEIPQQVRWEAEQVFPTDISNVLISHQVIGEGENVPLAPPGTKGWDVLLIGAQKQEVENLQSVLLESGAQLKIIDLDSLATADAANSLLHFPPGESVALVDIGALGTRVSVWKNGKVEFFREFTLGGYFFTDSLARTLGVSHTDAEALKVTDGKNIPQEAMDALQGALNRWKAELQQSEDIYVSQSSRELIQKWCFFGGGVLTPGLMESVMQDRIGPKVLKLDWNSLFQTKNKSIDPTFLANWAPRLLTVAGLTSRKA
ncbi:MAG: type IV pilus assembly protein PilM [Bdellovibrionota bacterium]